MKDSRALLAEDQARSDRALAAQVRTLMGGSREVRGTLPASTLTSPQDWLLGAVNGGPTKSGARVNESTAFNVTAVRACVALRANLLAMLPVKLYRKTPTGPKEQDDHPLSRLMRRKPTRRHTKFKWVHYGQVCFDLGGAGFSRVHRNAYFEVERLEVMKPSETRTLLRSDDRLVFDFKGERLEDFEVLRVSNLSTDGTTPRSPLHDLREAVGLSMAAEEFTARTFVNGNRSPGVFVGKENYTAEKANTFFEWYQKHYAGAANAGKTPFIWGGVDWKDAGFTLQEAELLGQRKFSIEEIARVYQIPLHLIGSTEKATTWGSGIDSLNRGLVDYTLSPLCKNWEEEMNTTLLTEREQDEGYYFKFVVDALLRADLKTRAMIYQTMRGIAAMDVNQIRRLEEWEEYPDAWAGDPRLPMNNQGGGGTQPEPAKAGANNPEDNAQ